MTYGQSETYNHKIAKYFKNLPLQPVLSKKESLGSIPQNLKILVG